MKRIYTPGDVAKILEKAKSTVSEWIHAEKLKARKSPGGNWQIMRPDLIEFMNEYDYPLDLIDGGREMKKRVLIADDDPDVLNMLYDAFDKEPGYEVKTAKDGFEAGMAAKEYCPHVIILDIKLNGMDGRSICRTIRKNPELRRTKVIGISGEISEEEEKEILTYGFDRYLSKPFDIDEFKALVKRLA